MAVARGDFVAVMAADLQEPVQVVAAFFDVLESGTCDIVFGERTKRSDPRVGTWGSRGYWWLYRRFVNRDVPVGGVDVFGCTREVCGQVVAFTETHSSLVGLLFWVGYRRSFIPYERAARHSGQSGWTLRRKVRYLFDSVYAFTDLPVILLQVVGAIGFVLSAIVGVVVFVAWLMGTIKQPGYTPLMIAILASTSAILLALGVVGSYVWRGYENGKGRPLELTATHEVLVKSRDPIADDSRSGREESEMKAPMDVFVHSAGICETEDVGPGTRIWAFAHVLPGAVIGRDCNICDHVFIENDVVIGDRVTIKSGVQLWDGVRLGQRRLRRPECRHSRTTSIPKAESVQVGLRKQSWPTALL